MKRHLITALVTLAAAASMPSYGGDFAPDAGFVSLFNGKDLTGWCFREKVDRKAPKVGAVTAAHDGKTEADDGGKYLVQDGIFTIRFPEEMDKLTGQIYTVQEFPKNFILKLEFRASVNADSGIFIRRPQLQCRDYPVAGPEAYKHLKNYKPQDWNKIEVVVKDGTARCTCNGELLEEALAVPETGPIGLEGDRGQMEYRHIQIKTLE